MAGENIAHFRMSRDLNNQVSTIYVNLQQLLVDNLAVLGDRASKHRSQALGDKGTAEDLSLGPLGCENKIDTNMHWLNTIKT